MKNRTSVPRVQAMRTDEIPPARDARESEAGVGLFHRFLEQVILTGEAERARGFLAADFVEHGHGGDLSAAGFIARLADRHARYPQAEWTIDLLAGVGGLVVCQATMAVTTGGERPLHARETIVVRFAGDKMRECWRLCDRRLG
jgi:predicted SnoaL-like aldol condensation-catalyzing enzyme